MAVKKKLRSILKKSAASVMEPERNREPLRKTCPKCNEKVKSCIPSSPSLDRYRMCRPVRSAAAREKLSRRNVRDCYGSGYVTKKKKIKVTIPAGIDNGQSVRCAGGGEPGGQWRRAGRSAGRGSSNPSIRYLSARITSNFLHSSDFLCYSGTGRSYSHPHCRRRSRIRGEGRNPDRYPCPPERKRRFHL